MAHAPALMVPRAHLPGMLLPPSCNAPLDALWVLLDASLLPRLLHLSVRRLVVLRLVVIEMRGVPVSIPLSGLSRRATVFWRCLIVQTLT